MKKLDSDQEIKDECVALKGRDDRNQGCFKAKPPKSSDKRKLSEVLVEIGRDDDLADRIEAASIEMRQSRMRDVDL